MELVFWRTLFCDADDHISNSEELTKLHNWFCLEMQMNVRIWDSRLMSDRDYSGQI
jgi:hypothetical protein